MTLLQIMAVVVSLVFVGSELRLNTAAVSSESAYQLNLSMDSRYRMMAQDAGLAELVTKGYESLYEAHFAVLSICLTASARFFNERGPLSPNARSVRPTRSIACLK